jgi:precorrin-3B C17-methyltransferase
LSDRAGELFIVGIGPGDYRHVTRAAEEILRSADCIVGFEGYVELLRSWLPDASFSSSRIGAETARAQEAIARAQQGQRVALVGSGDAGVYGLAGLALQLLAERDAVGLRVEILPGVTAASACAALLGAPLGNDFAVISLSDLLTPWPIIERRLEAAAAADFVTVLYNPASRLRRMQIVRALEILRRHRPPETPVGHVESAYRESQRVSIGSIAEFDTQSVGMLSTIVIGNSKSIRWNGRMITPRGYELDRRIAEDQAESPRARSSDERALPR